MLASISVPAARYPTAPSTPMEATTPGRKSSLLLARIRRTTTEEADEQPPQAGRRSSLLLRSRRTVTEEPEEVPPPPPPAREGRKTSLLLRSRKATNEDDDESRFRVPSRAITEVNSLRALPRDSSAAPQSPAEPLSASAVLPRRRLIPSSISTRLAAAMPTSSAPTTPARKYLERGTATPLDRSTYLEPQRGQSGNNSISERLAEERGQQRQSSLGGHASALLSRSNSVGRRGRQSSIPGIRS